MRIHGLCVSSRVVSRACTRRFRSIGLAAALLVLLFIAGSCATTSPDRPPETQATDDEEAPLVSEPEEERISGDAPDYPPEQSEGSTRQVLEYHTRDLASILPDGIRVLRDDKSDDPFLIRTAAGYVVGVGYSPDATYVIGTAGSSTDEQEDIYMRRIGDVCVVNTFRPHSDATAPIGFEAMLTCGNREVSLFVLPRNIGDLPPTASETAPGPYVLVEPLSAVRRTVLRDLNGDGFPELLRYSRIFEDGGRRETLIEAYYWTGHDYSLRISTSVLRRINDRFSRLERSLRDPPHDSYSARVDRALVPLDGAPPASSLMPVGLVRLPRILDMPLQLGAARWQFDHEIALEEFLYRFTVHVQANPLVSQLVHIENLDTPVLE